MKNNFKWLFIILPKVLCWIHQGFNLSVPGNLRDYKFLISKLELVYQTRGSAECLKYFKGIRLALLNYLSGSKVRVPGVRCTRDGLPMILGPWHKELRMTASPDILRMLLTILFSTRALRLGSRPDINPIINPSLSTCVEDFSLYSKAFWKELGYRPSLRIPKSLKFKSYHLTTKSGPNGHALWNCLCDLYILPESLLESIRIVGGSEITSRISTLFSLKRFFQFFLPTNGRIFRKISYFADKEMKVRVIAVLDYWSQTVLKPLHHYLFRVLKKIPQDCTFDQGSFWDKIKGAKVFYSIDLTAATDRFPISLISTVLEANLPPDYVSAWRDVMVGYPFWFSDTEELSYSVGNPMGAYSSWSSFAVCHHFVVYYCCRRLNLDWKTMPYCLLGDDIVIGHEEVAKLYLSTINSLGVEVSELKTHVSSTTLEFAKRWIHKGQEITPFPVSALKESESRSYILTSLLLEQETKGWLALDGIPSLVNSYYGIVKCLPSRLRKVYTETSYISELIMKVMRGALTADVAMNSFIRYWGLPIRELDTQESNSILENIAVELFCDSNPENDDPDNPKGIGLGLLAEDLVCKLTGLEGTEFEAFGFDGIYALPHLGAYALIEEMFMSLKREAMRLDSIGANWPMIMKTMALPLDDKIFVQRSSHLISRASTIMGSKVKERLEILVMYPKMLPTRVSSPDGAIQSVDVDLSMLASQDIIRTNLHDPTNLDSLFPMPPSDEHDDSS